MVNLPVVEEVKTSCVCWSETLKEGSKVTEEKGKQLFRNIKPLSTQILYSFVILMYRFSIAAQRHRNVCRILTFVKFQSDIGFVTTNFKA